LKNNIENNMITPMKGFDLDKDQLAELRQAHKLEKKSGNVACAYKLNAIILLGSGWKLREVKEALLLDDETLRSYVDKYRSGGIKLLLETHYKGSQAWLTDEQLTQLADELDSNIHLDIKSVINYVLSNFEVEYSSSGMRAVLHRIGFVYKKPKLVPKDPDVVAQEIWVEQYEKFMDEKPADIEVLFVDAVHPTHNTMAAYGWIRKGTVRKIESNSGRDRLNLHGAINAETMDVTVIDSDTVNSDSTIDLIQVLDQKYANASEIVLILDNARYHYSKEVKKALEAHRRVRLVFLPPYSPNLNLIERLWRFFKKNVLYNKFHNTKEAFRRACIDFFQQLKDRKSELHSLMGGGFEV